MQVVKFIESVVNSLDFSVKINSFAVVGTTTVLNVCYTYHARKGTIITISTVDYTVLSVVNNTSITIEGTPSTPLELTIQRPYYLHGTAMATNNELTKLDRSIKYPFIYLFEQITERYNSSSGSTIDRDADLRLYFLDNANFQDWTTDEHYEYVIDSMRNLQELFIKTVKKHKYIGNINEYEVINHVKFGIWTERGHEKRVFNDHLSGVELLLTMSLMHEFCENNC